MTTRRRLLGAGTLLAVSASSGGCVTRSLFANERYTESVSSILITSDGRQLVFIGKRYHYVFEAPPALVESLSADFRPVLDARFDTFEVDASGRITGTVRLSLGSRASEEQKQASLVLGFEREPRRSGYATGRRVTLSGQRYASEGRQAVAESQKLNREYKVFVDASQSTGALAAKTLLTPVTVAADGLLMIGAVPLFLLVVGAFGVMCAGQPDCLK